MVAEGIAEVAHFAGEFVFEDILGEEDFVAELLGGALGEAGVGAGVAADGESEVGLETGSDGSEDLFLVVDIDVIIYNFIAIAEHLAMLMTTDRIIQFG